MKGLGSHLGLITSVPELTSRLEESLDFERRGFYRVDHLEWGNDLHLRNAMNLG
jgi:hypothetical protein